MSAASPLTLSSLDVERLERLLENTELARQPMAQALRAEIDRAHIVSPEALPADVVSMNSSVHCREEGSGQDYHFTLVYPRDADAAAGRVSVLAPVGAALLGLSVGQSIEWQAPAGRLTLRVVAIRYQPESAGELHR